MTNSKLWLDLCLKVKRWRLDQIRPKTLFDDSIKVSPCSSSLLPRRNCQAHDVLPQGAAEFEVLKVSVVNIYKEILKGSICSPEIHRWQCWRRSWWPASRGSTSSAFLPKGATPRCCRTRSSGEGEDLLAPPYNCNHILVKTTDHPTMLDSDIHVAH